MDFFVLALAAFSIAATAVHVATTWIVGSLAQRAQGCGEGHRALDDAEVAIVRPVHGLTDVERATLASTFNLPEKVSIVFCASKESDPAIPYLRDLAARHPGRRVSILVGDDLGTPNPKLNNIAKGWNATSAAWVVITDSNLYVPGDYIDRLRSHWDADCGLVSAPPIGCAPGTFWAEVECAFLNTYQARWQYAADVIGLGFAQGKTMLWRKHDLDSAGGIVALSRDLAEDAAATKVVQSLGKRVRVAAPSFYQPLGERSRVAVLARQQRWAQLRRLTFPVFFIPEVLTGSILPILSGAAAAIMLGVSALMTAAVLLVVWLGSEALLARRAGWPLGWRSPLAWIIRDLLLPYIWFKAWMSNGYEWQGNRIEVAPKHAAKMARTEMPA